MTFQSILGWDIGIKNLSYCKLKEVDSSQTASLTLNQKHIKVECWDVINLAESTQKQLINSENEINLNNISIPTCFKSNKNGKPCSKKAQFILITSASKGVCQKHFKDLDTKTKKDYLKIEKKPICFYDGCQQKSKFVDSSNYFISYCKKHTNLLLKEPEQTKIFIKIGKQVRVQHMDLSLLGKLMYDSLDKIENKNMNLTKSDMVLLENQPVLKNPTMKSVQMLLYSYFIMNGIMKNNQEMKIKCYPANKKMATLNYLSDEKQSQIKEAIKSLKGNYIKNKKSAILITQDILKDNTELLDFFNNHKKKDDLADSLLMSIIYCLTN